jgi:hypothetical protein
MFTPTCFQNDFAKIMKNFNSSKVNFTFIKRKLIHNENHIRIFENEKKKSIVYCVNLTNSSAAC